MWYSTLGCLVTLFLSLLAVPFAAEAQPLAKMPRIGILVLGTPPHQGFDELRHGLRDLGYVEGQTIVFESRWAEFKFERLPALAAELVRLPVDVLVTHGPQGVRAAKDATSTIPIVMARMDDAEEHGFVASLARPGGNVTGLSHQTGELSGKWLEFLQEVRPRLGHVAVLWDATGTVNQLRTLESAARTMDVRLHVLEVRGRSDFDGAFATAKTVQPEGLVLLGSPLLTLNAPRLAELVAQHRLPAIYSDRRFVEAGGLMAYGAKESDPSWGWRRAVVYVDKILKGAKPADLPVERPSQFALVINLKTAQALGLTVPSSLLFQADEVIQ
jgi:putative tryptophan/tyrosine transport system substrate-binding protein